MIRVPCDPLAEGDLSLPAAVQRYVVRVHRLKVGDRFVAFDPQARLEADAELISISRAGAQVRLSNLRPAPLLAARQLTVIQSAVKGSKLDGIVRSATELGATRIVVATAHRSVSRPTAARLAARLGRIAVEAARQCGRGDAPEVLGPEPFEAALATYAAESGRCRALCLQPGSSTKLHQALADLAEPEVIALAIGPEGGLTEDELAVAGRHGFQLVSLGRFVLRTETACTAALGVVATLT
jgi:16S rRNA (uracil1498-N3)-methyltransferase